MTQGADTIGRRSGEAIIESSPHAAFGLVTCVRDGCICWRGPIEHLPADIDFDTVYCHDDDAEHVRRTLLACRNPAKKKREAAASRCVRTNAASRPSST